MVGTAFTNTGKTDDSKKEAHRVTVHWPDATPVGVSRFREGASSLKPNSATALMAYLAAGKEGNDVKLSGGRITASPQKEDFLFILGCQKEKGVEGRGLVGGGGCQI